MNSTRCIVRVNKSASADPVTNPVATSARRADCDQSAAISSSLPLTGLGLTSDFSVSGRMAERYHMAAGEDGFAIETDQGVLLTAYDPTFEKAMQVYERGAHKYRNALRELAK